MKYCVWFLFFSTTACTKHVPFDEQPQNSAPASSPPRTVQVKQVIMYSASSCSYCEEAREYFRKKNIPYTELDIEKDRQARRTYDSLGCQIIPVIFVGQECLNGFSVQRFEKLYQ